MGRRGLRPSIAAAAVLLGAAIVIAQAAEAQPVVQAEAPTFNPGDSWTTRYSDGTRAKRTFLRRDAGLLVFDVSQTWPDGVGSKALLYLTPDLATARIVDDSGTELQRFVPHSLGLQFPLTVGKQWEATSQRFDQGRLAGTYEGKFRVAGVENVVSRAGTFEALRVEGETFDVQSPGPRWHFTYWYAPATGMEVLLRAVDPDGKQTQLELVEFQPAGSARPTPPGAEAFLGLWDGHWQEILLATRLSVEKVEGDRASVIYWRGAVRFPGFQRPSQQRLEGRLLDGKTLKVDVWDDAARRWADVTYTLNPDGTLTGLWLSGGGKATGILQKEP